MTGPRNKQWDKVEINDHIAYLTQTLIPDLHQSGLDGTANDFKICVSIIQQLMQDEVRVED